MALVGSKASLRLCFDKEIDQKKTCDKAAKMGFPGDIALHTENCQPDDPKYKIEH